MIWNPKKYIFYQIYNIWFHKNMTWWSMKYQSELDDIFFHIWKKIPQDIETNLNNLFPHSREVWLWNYPTETQATSNEKKFVDTSTSKSSRESCYQEAISNFDILNINDISLSLEIYLCASSSWSLIHEITESLVDRISVEKMWTDHVWRLLKSNQCKSFFFFNDGMENKGSAISS